MYEEDSKAHIYIIFAFLFMVAVAVAAVFIITSEPTIPPSIYDNLPRGYIRVS